MAFLAKLWEAVVAVPQVLLAVDQLIGVLRNLFGPEPGLA
jgi:hypothetical protein